MNILSISQLLFALTTSTIIVWATIGLIALAIKTENKDNEKTPSCTIIGLLKGMFAAANVLSLLTILATVLAFIHYNSLV